MNTEFEFKLIESLSALEQGESIEQILARFPEDAAQLRPMLITAAALPALRMQPSEAQKMASRQKFLSQAAALRKSPASPRKLAVGVMPRFVFIFAALSLIFVVLSGTAVAAAGSALPGDPLYGLKRTIESVRLTLATNGAAHTNLQNEFDQIRRNEANALLDAGRQMEVEFNGSIESIQPASWVIGGLVVRIDAATRISGQPQIDRVAEVKGVTTRDGLTAAFITIEGGEDTTPTPLPSSTPTDTPTPIASSTPKPTESPESRPTAARPQNTPEPEPTHAPTPIPTSQPTEIEFTGTVDSMGDTWSISGAVVTVNGDTEISGDIRVGQRVKVKAIRLINGQLLARQIELTSDGGGGGTGGGDGNQNDNHNTNRNENENRNDNENRNENENRNSNENRNGNENRNSNENHNGGGEDNKNQNDN